jgi:hypothetical protein
MKDAGKHRRCPRCGSDRLHPSHRRGFAERAMYLIGADIQRCYSCRARLCWFGLASIRLGEEASDAILSAGAVICLGSALSIATVFWLITRLGAG